MPHGSHIAVTNAHQIVEEDVESGLESDSISLMWKVMIVEW
jgi:hypothetical protein